MTTTPIGPPPVAVADPNIPGAPGSTADGTTGDAFLALVQALLDAGPVPQPVGASTAAGGHGTPADAADDASASEPTDETAAAIDPDLVPGLAPNLVPVIVAGLTIPVPITVARSSSGPASGPTVAAADAITGVGAESSTSALPVASPGAGPAATAPAATAPATTAPATTAPAATAPAAPAPARSLPAEPPVSALPGDPAADAPLAEPGALAARADRGTSDTGPRTQSTAGVNPTAATATPLAAASAPVAATSAPAGAPASTASSAVAHQVFPEVVRLTTSSDGPQRVTIRLNPESLGEVRVVLTQRQGGLEVSLSAGTEARRALADGTPELQRLLDAVGRSDARIVVRDGTGLPVASSAPSAGTSGQAGTQQPGAGSQWSTDLSGGAWTGADRNGGEATGGHGRSTRPGSSNATDGIPDATTPSRRPATVTGARSGLDVTM
ncbi:MULTISPECIES: flagellar hook-length control protein FliK [unclassified Nocardioides]|uniref:flagellar hook-length control protein FliK n=1 Tax=unclassified Nocardioides TaxID=2615069 RepID=UPI00005707EA|nr:MULTISPECIES: flagellar hook-length control protein FliK [unclassified Nocardioides]ABL80278.1 flagellar hook-length control protein [Nocardioides sp. JS614]